MQHPIHRVTKCEFVRDFVLHVTFDDCTEQTIDFRPVLGGRLLGPLRDHRLFSQVRIDPEVHTLVWPDGADFDPATLHNWPDHVKEFADRTREWDTRSAPHPDEPTPRRSKT